MKSSEHPLGYCLRISDLERRIRFDHVSEAGGVPKVVRKWLSHFSSSAVSNDAGEEMFSSAQNLCGRVLMTESEQQVIDFGGRNRGPDRPGGSRNDPPESGGLSGRGAPPSSEQCAVKIRADQ